MKTDVLNEVSVEYPIKHAQLPPISPVCGRKKVKNVFVTATIHQMVSTKFSLKSVPNLKVA